MISDESTALFITRILLAYASSSVASLKSSRVKLKLDLDLLSSAFLEDGFPTKQQQQAALIVSAT